MSFVRALKRWFDSDDARALVHGDREQIEQVEVILKELEPALRADGGSITLVAIDDGWVTVRMHGACSRCSARDQTLHGALEPALRSRCAWFRGMRSA